MIERKVYNALQWKQKTLNNGGDLSEVEEIMQTLLEPSYKPEEPIQTEITDEKIQEIAQQANQENEYDSNIEELSKVIPADIPINLIKLTLGSTWVPTNV